MAWYTRLGMAPRIIVPVSILLIAVLGTLTWQIQTRTSAATQEMARRELADLATAQAGPISTFLSAALTQADTLAGGLGQALKSGIPVSRELLVAMLEGLHSGNSAAIGSGAVWEPGAEYARQRCRRQVHPLYRARRAGYPAYGVRKGRLLPGTQNQKKALPDPAVHVRGRRPDSAHDHGGGPGSGGRNIPGRRDR